MVLARQPICGDPYKRHVGVVVPATVADHIISLSKGGTWSLRNGQGLCASCHGVKNAKEDGAFGRTKEGGHDAGAAAVAIRPGL